ncbi:hypothetical protein C5N14_28875 [Micromonospora sp. MW-13]|uniref:hypothetical protein n=1 Tax=Micromonospora sp. MW-13 TaxID=2094022 RepID=UPI000EF0CD13|nr:hypothetical protein [Micromonospora sp. MW-13]RGC65363.1 hypothetical protein C5N14_28875 [Micromonospora sp. MW-13]
MNTHTRWTMARIRIGRRGALGVAGLTLATSVAASVTGALAAPSSVPSVAATQQAGKTSDKHVDYRFQEQPNLYFCGPASTRIALSA